MFTTYEAGSIAAGETSVIALDRLWKSTNETPVIYCHHATGASTTIIDNLTETNASIRRMVEGLTSRGLPVISNDQSGPSNWSTDLALTRVTGALTRIGAITGARTDRVLLLGDSMGATVALNWARANPTLVRAIALVIPVVNLEHAHDETALAAGIEAAYGGLAGYQAALPNKNPALFHSSYVNIPIKFWYSEDDPAAVASEVTDFATATSHEAISMGSTGHTIPSSFDVDPVVDFLHSYK